MLDVLVLDLNTRFGGKLKNYASAIVWFIVVAVVIYAFYCTTRGYDFGVIANPFKVGCYK